MSIISKIQEIKRKNGEKEYVPWSERHPYLPLILSIVSLVVSFIKD